MPEIRREETSGSSRGRDGENAQAELELALERADGSGGEGVPQISETKYTRTGGGLLRPVP